MIKIGLLSDTHGHIDEKMLNFLNPVNEIWHAGDIGDINVLDELKGLKKIRAVYGNIDNQVVRIELPEISIFTVENVKVILTHIGGYPKSYTPEIKKLLIAEKPQLFISGHSHILRVIYDNNLECLHINPGAAGIQGFHKVRTMVRFSIDDTKIKDLEIWEYKR